MNFLMLGMRNIMFTGEGLGAHLCKQLEKSYKLNHPNHILSFIDGGTLTLQLNYIIVEYDEIVTLDFIDAGDVEVGKVFFFPYETTPKKVNQSESAHEVEILQTLQYMELVGDLPHTQILAAVPGRIGPMSSKLSDEIIKAASVMERVLLDYPARKGFNYEKVGDSALQDLTQASFKP